MKASPVSKDFVVEVSELNLSAPLGSELIARIHRLMNEFGIVVFRGPPLSQQAQLAFSRSLGQLEQAIAVGLRKPEEHRLPTSFADVSNLDQNNQPFARDDRRRLFSIGNRLWHSDSSFKTTPASYSLLHALSITSRGGNTEFADMRAAYDALDARTQADCEDLICEHSQLHSRQQLGFTEFSAAERERMAPVYRRLVRTHPGSGRKSLYLSSHAGAIVGWPVPEARCFLRDLNEHATEREFVYIHQWQVGDLVVYDNRCTMHRARPFPAEERRDMRRTTLVGDGPTVSAAELEALGLVEVV